MMKFIVDEGWCYAEDYECPRKWSKEKICSNENPHECEWLKEQYELKHW